MLAGLLARREVAALADAQYHVEEAVVLPVVGDGIMLAPHGADADAAEREDTGLDCRLAHDFAHRCDVEMAIEVR